MRSILQHLFVLCVSVFLVACETELGEEPLRILNESALPTEMTWYSPIDVPIEITGGQGSYAVRYIQNPESWMTEEEIGDVEDVNRVELSIVHEAGSTFRLQGTPIPASGIARDADSSFWIEATDGVNRVLSKVDFSIDDVFLDDLQTFVSFSEGEANLKASSGPDVRGKTVCPETQQVQQDPIVTAMGKAYPVQVLVKLSQPISIPVVFDVYIEELSNGQNPAAENVDFLHSEERLVFEEGITACAVTFYVIDDAEIEPPETLRVVARPVGNLVDDISDGSFNVTINDNEPSIDPFDLSFLRSPGETVQVVIDLDGIAENDVLVPFSVNDADSNLLSEDYTVTPASRVITIQKGQRQGFFSIALGANIQTSVVDPSVMIEVQGNGAREPKGSVSITVNSFNQADHLDVGSEEMVFGLSEAAEALYVASVVDIGANKVTRIRKYNSFGALEKLNGASFYEIGSSGSDLVVKGIDVISSSGGVDELALVLETSVNFAGSFWGKKDFSVVHLSISSDGVVTEVGRTQHGSEQDDIVESVVFYEGKGLLITGSTQGATLDGEAVITPRGQFDGFIYNFEPSLDIKYRRFVGDSSDNSVLASGFGDTGAQAISSNDEGLVFSSFDENGFADSELGVIDIYQPDAFNFAGARNYSSDKLGLVVSSKFDNNVSVTPSLSQDVFFYDLVLRENGSVSAVFSIATGMDDVAIDLAAIEDKEVMGLVGETLGEFVEGGSLSGVGGRDLFFAAIDAEGTPVLNTVTQFGTPGDDYAIDVEAVNDEKFLVLWKENHTSGDGSFRYRITPFAPDGTNLAPLY